MDTTDPPTSGEGSGTITRRAILQAAGAAATLGALVALASPAQAVGPWGGYSNGNIPASALTPLSWAPGKRLRADAAADLEKLNTAFGARFPGRGSIGVTDAYRDYAEQVRLKAKKGDLAATPGKSNHGWALAVDLGTGINGFGTPEHTWMRANAPAYGWIHPDWAHDGKGIEEPWHWEYIRTGESTSTGPDPDTDPTPDPEPVEEEMAVLVFSSRGFALLDGGQLMLIGDQATVNAYKACGIRQATITDADFDRHLASSKSTFLIQNSTRGFAIWAGGKGTGIGDMAVVNQFRSAGVPTITLGDADFARFTS